MELRVVGVNWSEGSVAGREVVDVAVWKVYERR